jgi:alpha-D-xyloside xylohydrolase
MLSDRNSLLYPERVVAIVADVSDVVSALCRRWTTVLLVLSAASASAQGPPAHSDVVLGTEQSGAALLVRLNAGVLRLKPCGDGVVRVTFAPGTAIPDLSNPALADRACADTPFITDQTAAELLLHTGGLTVAVSRNSGAVRFRENAGATLLEETDWPFPRQVSATVTDGMATDRASVWFALTPEESLYGLGQHQTGQLNLRNQQFELTQDNTNISVPFFLSSKGYGVLWNNSSRTDWNNRFQQVLAIRSDVAEAVDYYFIPGPSFDRIIAGYRRLTGAAPLMPQWAYGYWQSKLAYASREELLDTAAKYRQLQIPLDNIVLDEGWETGMGSHTFTSAYPDMRGAIQTLHDEHVHLMTSIWPIYQPGNANFHTMAKNGWFVSGGVNSIPPFTPGSRLYDAFNPRARAEYWREAKRSLYDIGVDAFWLDSTEPLDAYGEEHGSLLAGAQTALGNGSAYINLFPLLTTSAIYNGQRGVGDKRVFILTRSAYLGMQRNAAAAWSGDTLTTWQAFRRQIPAALNYSMTGLPYWTSDIGGFVGGHSSDPAYRELFVRWFEYGAFCPIFRAHGAREDHQDELWSFGPEAQQVLTLYDRLRYRLMPYIYAMAAKTTFDGYTPMRALAFDFRDDPKGLNVSDEFLYGPALLVAPVTEAGATGRDVYLPAGANWYDFWTGAWLHGGQTVHRNAPLNLLPLYVRAGTVLLLGQEEQYAGQYSDAPIELRVYPGNDGGARLYDDDGTTYRYERGERETLAIHWDDASRSLTFDPVRGNLPGTSRCREFRVAVVSAANGTGEDMAQQTRPVHYAGAAMRIAF